MSPTQDFNQMKELINRLCQANAGTSVDAHEEPLPDTGLTLVEAAQASAQAGPPTVEPADEELFQEVCGLSHLYDFKWGRSLAPEPITAEFEWAGSTVWESEELMAIYRGFQQAVQAGCTQAVRIETGTYRLAKPPGLNWQLLDAGKGLLYVQELSSQHLPIGEKDLFIWVLLESDPTQCLGYIHDAYVFLKRETKEEK